MTEYTKIIEDLAIDSGQIEASAKRLEAAIEAAEAAANEIEAANEQKRELAAKVIAGSPDVTEGDLAKANVKIEFASLRGKGADQRLAQARNRRDVTDTDLIEAVHSALDGLLEGVDLYVGIGEAPTALPKGIKAPALILTQRVAHKTASDNGAVSIEGAVTGTVSLLYFRDAVHRELEIQQVEKALSRAHIAGHVHARSADGHDALTLNITKAAAAVPSVSHRAKAVGVVNDSSYATWRGFMQSAINAGTLNSRGEALFGTERFGVAERANVVGIDYSRGAKGVAEVAKIEEADGITTVTLVVREQVVCGGNDPRRIEEAIRAKVDKVRGATLYGQIVGAEFRGTHFEPQVYGTRAWMDAELTLTMISKA